MKTQELQNAVNKLMAIFRGSFINHLNELILVPKTNLYFRLDDIETLLDLKCKVIAWCSRHAFKTEYCNQQWRNGKYQAEVRERINKFLGVEFGIEEWELIYAYLGNDIRRKVCEKFIESGYDLEVIKRECEKK